MGDHGEDFAGVIDSILRNAQKGSDYVSWLKELTPNELDEVKILVGARNDRLFAVTKNGVDYPADILSDGTLRFAAIAAAFFQPVPPRLLLLEEIEEGLHPTRLQLLVELLKSQSGRGIEQVIATSHSPYAIAWLKEEDYRYVFLCTKDEETGATTITPFSEVPHLIEVARRHPISDLIVQGWLENAV
jgi:predicted ATPase